MNVLIKYSKMWYVLFFQLKMFSWMWMSMTLYFSLDYSGQCLETCQRALRWFQQAFKGFWSTSKVIFYWSTLKFSRMFSYYKEFYTVYNFIWESAVCFTNLCCWRFRPLNLPKTIGGFTLCFVRAHSSASTGLVQTAEV